MAKINLGLHLGFATTRFTDLKTLAKIISNEFEINHVQYVSDIINPFLPKSVIKDKSHELKNIFDKFGIISKHSFTSSRNSYFADRDKRVREMWLKWFDNFFLSSSILGVEGAGSILSILDFQQLNNFNKNRNQVISYWKELSYLAKKRKLKYLMWEPMSVRREFGDTIKNTSQIHNLINKRANIPILLNLDVDHGNHYSNDKNDSNPYAWLKNLSKFSPSIHIKQKTKDIYTHKPFIKKYNKNGIIKPIKIIKTLSTDKIKEYYLYFEFSFREREPFDSSSIKDIKESVTYWKKYLNQG